MDRAYDESGLYTNTDNSFELDEEVVAYICNEVTGKAYEEDCILGGVSL